MSCSKAFEVPRERSKNRASLAIFASVKDRP